MTFSIPPIEDREIAWASELMGLGPNGFAAIDGDDSRLKAIKNLQTCDFEACPGSGKTTLLVAKLAILASRWPYRQSGICVLSHTNAARDEINHRVSIAASGSSLVRYPHFIGTIHGFVNEFLTTPWLRSKGNPVRLIDTDIALKRRFWKLAKNWRFAMEQRGLDRYALQYDKSDYSGENKGKLARDTPLCHALEAASREGSQEGYFCFDEMFVWANELLDKYPEVAANLRRRFPLVFIDEAQDNSELQSNILHRIFLEGDAPSIRQRFGDSNQAIYAHNGADGATTDSFPSGAPHNLPRSYRFPQGIANVAKGLGIVPQELKGSGPTRSRISREALPPVLFLFDDESALNVLRHYGNHLISMFDSQELSAGVFTAVAGVHELDDKAALSIPRAMGHYAPAYDPVSAKKESTPRTFGQYLSKSSRDALETSNAQGIVNALASALLRFAELAGTTPTWLGGRKSAHRIVLDALEGSSAEGTYRSLLDKTITLRGQFDAVEWQSALPQVTEIGSHLAQATKFPQVAIDFLTGPDALQSPPAEASSSQTILNFYSHPPEMPKVRIRLGSIHSVKGETHTATLVLDSFYYEHHLSKLKPWILGERAGGMKKKAKGKPELESSRLLGRLKLHYVAMTRPSHLLCLAMRRDAFNPAELKQLQTQGWQLVDCNAD